MMEDTEDTPTRRRHTKSRNGCMQCKSRKVKCNEAKPICGNCTKRHTSCTYRDGSPHISLDQLHAERDSDAGQRSPSRFAQPSPQPPLPSALPHDALPQDQLELLHHYTTATYLTLVDGPSSQLAWQVSVVQEAFSHDFLMHGILAISALHLARLRPVSATHFQQLATLHYSKGVSLFRPMLDRVTKVNAQSIFAFSSLVVCISFAMPPDLLHQSEPQSPSAGSLMSVLEVFDLCRSINNVLHLTWHWLLESPLASQLHIKPQKPSALLAYDDGVALDLLEKHIDRDLPSEPRKRDYREALNGLREIYAHSCAAAEHKSTILAWPVLVPLPFYQAMGESEPLATVFLSYYGALLHDMRDTWWVGNTGMRIVSACSEQLDDNWTGPMLRSRQRVGLP